MSILSSVRDLLLGNGSSLVSEIKDIAMAYFPPDMPPEKRMEFELRAQQVQFEKEKQLAQVVLDAEKSITERTAMLEGTASDLKGIPYIGPLVLFLRGLQRIAWGYATIYIDWLWFTGQYEFSPIQDRTLLIVNVLVLGFLFGERAVQNVAPMLNELLIQRQNAAAARNQG